MDNLIANDFHEKVMGKVFYPNAAKKIYEDLGSLRASLYSQIGSIASTSVKESLLKYVDEMGLIEAELHHLSKLWGLSFSILALAGEAGEAANEMKKIIRGDITSYDGLREELSDVQNYIVMSANELDLHLQDIFDTAIIKADDKNKEWYKEMHKE